MGRLTETILMDDRQRRQPDKADDQIYSSTSIFQLESSHTQEATMPAADINDGTDGRHTA